MKLLRGALKCMTTKYPLDYRSLNKADWDTIVKTKNHVQHWGTFEKSSFQIETHIPVRNRMILLSISSSEFWIP